ncbi:MAG: nicotinate phosphoribosyltransferase [Chitinophagales bacterium]|nr:nicotinate phosphoribosyltransferase [Bacteroidota bacterium]MCB9042517.1 nicotinate phosphoribosyltransferase [Chitinophagales bacterium]
MRKLFDKLSLYTDFYALALSQGLFYQQKHEDRVVFDYYFRTNPFDGGYVIFAGLENLIDIVENYQYDTDTLRYLREQGLYEPFLEYLANMKFRANIYAPQEGEVVFATAPVMRVEGNFIEVQLIETLLLNLINFQSLIATKASRVRQVVGDRLFIDFGLRRAQAWSGMHASRAAIIGGADLSSNTLGGYYHGLPLWNTMAHTWVQSFDDELTAFRKYVDSQPNEQLILLVDTYNTLQIGMPNAITVAKEMEKAGKRLFAVRLDSGDLAYLSKKARKMLDEADLAYVKIIVTNQLDEYLIRSLDLQKAPIDGFGIGTKLITAHGASALDGVFKMSLYNNKPSMKISNDLFKNSLPGRKKLWRFFDKEGYFYRDGILLYEENECETLYSAVFANQYTHVSGLPYENILQPVMENGKRLMEKKTIQQIKAYAQQRLTLLPEEHKRFENPHTYKVGISASLRNVRDDILQKHRNW